MRVDACDHGREDLHAAGFHGAFGRAQREPRPLAWIGPVAHGVGGRHAQPLGGRQARVEECVVAGVVGPAIHGEALVGRLQREVRRRKREIGKERRVVVGGTLAEIADDLVGEEARRVEVSRQRVNQPPVVAIRRVIARALDGLAIGEVARAARQQREAAVEAARGRTRGLVPAQVPLPGHVGAIAGLLQHGRQWRHRRVQMPFVARLILLVRRQVFPHVAESRHMGIGAAHEAGPRGRAGGRGAEARERQAAGCQPVDDRRANLAAVGAKVGVAHVVGDDEQDVWTPRRRRLRSRSVTASGQRHQEGCGHGHRESRRAGRRAGRCAGRCAAHDAHRITVRTVRKPRWLAPLEGSPLPRVPGR